MAPLKKCACIDSLYTELNFYDRFAAAKADGFDAVEFWNMRGRWVADTRRAAEAAGIPILGFNGCTEYVMLSPKERAAYVDYVKSSVAVAKEFGASSLTMHSNAMDGNGSILREYPELSSAEKTAAMVDALKECADIAGENGITLNLEPLNVTVDHPGCFLQTTEQAAEILTAVGAPNLKILFDVYHMQMTGENPVESIRKYGKLFGHVHVADAPGRHEPGTGTIPFGEVFAALQEVGYAGAVGYELFPAATTAEAVKSIFSR